jgi:hypothetical protein
VTVSTQNEETIYVVGASSELGQWNADRAIALSANSYTVQNPIWRGNVSFVTGQDVLYKYIKGGINGKVPWEAGPNRNFSVSAICFMLMSTVNILIPQRCSVKDGRHREDQRERFGRPSW